MATKTRSRKKAPNKKAPKKKKQRKTNHSAPSEGIVPPQLSPSVVSSEAAGEVLEVPAASARIGIPKAQFEIRKVAQEGAKALPREVKILPRQKRSPVDLSPLGQSNPVRSKPMDSEPDELDQLSQELNQLLNKAEEDLAALGRQDPDSEHVEHR